MQEIIDRCDKCGKVLVKHKSSKYIFSVDGDSEYNGYDKDFREFRFDLCGDCVDEIRKVMSTIFKGWRK